jgi:hypothetical protein
MWKSLAILVLCAGMGVGPAVALPCTLTTIRSEYWRYQDRPEHYVLVRGQFSDLRFRRYERRKDRTIWRATFTGFAPSSKGFDRPFTAEVTIVDRLFTGIEGGKPDPKRLRGSLAGVAGLVFLQRTGEAYLVETEFCTPILFPDPADVKPALACIAGRSCPRE